MAQSKGVDGQSKPCIPMPQCRGPKEKIIVISGTLLSVTTLVIGILALLSSVFQGLEVFNVLGTIGGACLTTIGGLAFLAFAFYICQRVLCDVSKKNTQPQISTNPPPQNNAKTETPKTQVDDPKPLIPPKDNQPPRTFGFGQPDDTPKFTPTQQTYPSQVTQPHAASSTTQTNPPPQFQPTLPTQQQPIVNPQNNSFLDSLLKPTVTPPAPTQGNNPQPNSAINQQPIPTSQPTMPTQPQPMTLQQQGPAFWATIFNSPLPQQTAPAPVPQKTASTVNPHMPSAPNTALPTSENPENKSNDKMHQANLEMIKMVGKDISRPQLLRLSADEINNGGIPWKEIAANTKRVNELLPLDLSRFSESKKILQLMDIRVIATLAPALTGEHFRYLTADQYKSPDFPGAEIAKEPNKIKGFLPTDISTFSESKKILQLMDIHVIAALAPVLTGEHFRYLTADQYKSPDFPGAEIAKEPNKIKEFLPMDLLHFAESSKILRLLDIRVIAALAPALTGEHLRHLSEDHYKSSDFPGAEIAKEPDKVKEFLPMDAYNFPESRKILRLMKTHVIAALAPALTGEHFRHLTEDQYKSSDFPGAEIAKYPEKVKQFLRTDGAYNSGVTIDILRQLHPDAKAALAPVLTPEQKNLL